MFQGMTLLFVMKILFLPDPSPLPLVMINHFLPNPRSEWPKAELEGPQTSSEEPCLGTDPDQAFHKQVIDLGNFELPPCPDTKQGFTELFWGPSEPVMGPFALNYRAPLSLLGTKQSL